MPAAALIKRGTGSQRQRAATASQNARAAQWPDDDLHKAKHLRNASEMTSMTFTLDADDLVAAQQSSNSAVTDRFRSSSRHMASKNDNGSVARRADNFTDSKAPMEAFVLEDLVDRLLDRPCSEADHKFITTFLCLYRKFAAPSEVITSILQKFSDLTEDHGVPHLTRIATQLRALALLVRWISEYPGDFAHPTTSLSLTNFAKSISQTPEFAYSSREILLTLENLKPDEDTVWACSDKNRGRASTATSFASIPSLKISLPASMDKLTLVSSQESGSPAASTEELVKHKKPGSGHSASSSITSSFWDREMSMSGSTLTLNNPFELAQRQVSGLMRPSKLPLNKAHWHEFMGIEDRVIAKELTRIDWILFSSIRPRDLIRHINVSGEARAATKGLETIDRMVAHFNHLASWLGQLVLLRDKPKHRAKMLEKCMSIAWILRQMKNYNGVGAFVAGLSNTSIARLHHTKALIDPAIAKNFMSLEILMSTGKGYFAYRLAWDNTSGSKIPFLPLHRHDLVVAEESNPTFADTEKTKINWTKFDVMGRSLWDIHKSQTTGFANLVRSHDVQILVMQGRVGEDVDDMLYDRSLQVEPAANRESVGRRSGWLRTS